MTNDNIKLLPHDRLVEKTILRFIPAGIQPNQITVLRLLLTPIVLYLMWVENWPWALGLFIFTALTDALDGSLARLRKQITAWGTIADPIADKIFIGSVVVLFVGKEVNAAFAGVIVLVEVLIALSAIWRHQRTGSLVSANGYGKLKMVTQVVGVSLLLLARVLGFELVVPFAIGTLSIAIIFAVVSLLTYGF